MSKLPLLCALLTERAAGFFAQAGQHRKYCFQEVLAGHKFHFCGNRAVRHAIVCFAIAMLFHDDGQWNTIKAKLARALADELRGTELYASRRALLLLLKTLGGGSARVSRKAPMLEWSRVNVLSVQDAVSSMRELSAGGPWGSLRVRDGWQDKSTLQLLLEDLPVDVADNSQSPLEVVGLDVPEVIRSSTVILLPLDALSGVTLLTRDKSDSVALVRYLAATLLAEKEHLSQSSYQPNPRQSMTSTLIPRSLAERLVDCESLLSEDVLGKNRIGCSVSSMSNKLCLGESLQVLIELRNPLSVGITLMDMKLELDMQECFDLQAVEFHVAAYSTQTVILSATPKAVGKFRVVGTTWSLGWVRIRQPLRKNGILLQKTLAQRHNRERAEDTSLSFMVEPSHALLHLSLGGIPADIIQGQISAGYLELRNIGGAPACDVEIKFSHPCFVASLEENQTESDVTNSSSRALPWIGESATVFRLPSDTILTAGASLRMRLEVRLENTGKTQLGVLVAYSVDSVLGTAATEDVTAGSARSSTATIEVELQHYFDN